MNRPLVSTPLLLALLLAGAGCASSGAAPPASGVGRVEAGAAADEQGLHLRLIAKLLDDDKPRAALAHLDALGPAHAAEPRVKLLRAEVLRKLTRFQEAYALYETLLDTPVAGQAWRGLALMQAAQGDLGLARQWLGYASDRLPTDPRIRNDLGYVLLLEGELDRASLELATAIELGDEQRAPRNLVLLLLVQGDDVSAEEVARRHLDPGAMAPMRERADALRARLGLGGGA